MVAADLNAGGAAGNQLTRGASLERLAAVATVKQRKKVPMNSIMMYALASSFRKRGLWWRW